MAKNEGHVKPGSTVTLCMLGNLYDFCGLLSFFEINFFKKFFHEHYQSAEQFGSRSG